MEGSYLGVRSIDEWMNGQCAAYRRKGFVVSLLIDRHILVLRLGVRFAAVIGEGSIS